MPCGFLVEAQVTFMRPGFAILVSVVLGVFPATARAQQPETFSSPKQLLEILQTGKGQERVRVNRVLHLRFMANQTCSAKTWRGFLERGKIGAVMQVGCDAGDRLVVLGLMKNGRWQYEGSAQLWDLTGAELRVQLEAVTDPPVEDIVVRDNGVSNGTGIWQADFMIFKVVRNRLRKVLDTVEYSHLQQWTEPFHWVDQESKFLIVPTTKKRPAEVDETMSLTSNSGTALLERSFQWSHETNTFDVGLWDSARVSSKPAPH